MSRDAQDRSTINDIIETSATEPLQFEPGSEFSYNVTGYAILGHIVENVFGKPIEEVAKEKIYGPLGMTQTSYGDYRAIIKNRNSFVYTNQNGTLQTWGFTYGISGTTAAGLNTTTSDLAKFFIALDSGTLLSQEAMKAMMSPTRLADGTEKNYGLGWVVDEYRGKKVYGHEGGGCSWIDYYPSEHLTVAVLCNLTGSKADEIVKGVADFYLK